MNEESTLIRVSISNYEEKNFQSWWIKFLAYARVKGFHSVLEDAGITITETDMETLEAKPSLTTGVTEARYANIGLEALLNKILAVSTADWP